MNTEQAKSTAKQVYGIVADLGGLALIAYGFIQWDMLIVAIGFSLNLSAQSYNQVNGLLAYMKVMNPK